MIYKVISGQATENEKAELDRWIAFDPSNKEDFDDMKFAVEGVKNTEERIQRSNSFYDGLRKIEGMIEFSKRKKKKMRLYKLAGLAVALIVFSLTTLYFFEWPPYSKIQVNSTEWDAIDKGTDKILLTSLKFDDVTLDEIISTLEKKYGLTFEVSTEELLSCRFTGTFYRDITVDDIIRTLGQSIGFDYSTLNKQKYELHGKGCKV